MLLQTPAPSSAFAIYRQPNTQTFTRSHQRASASLPRPQAATLRYTLYDATLRWPLRKDADLASGNWAPKPNPGAACIWLVRATLKRSWAYTRRNLPLLCRVHRYLLLSLSHRCPAPKGPIPHKHSPIPASSWRRSLAQASYKASLRRLHSSPPPPLSTHSPAPPTFPPLHYPPVRPSLSMASNPFYFPAHEVQRPTHDRIHIRSAEDAHILFESVRLGSVLLVRIPGRSADCASSSVLRPVIRRLNDAERSAFIRSGSVFIWEESEEAIGLRRVSAARSYMNRPPSRMLTMPNAFPSSGQTGLWYARVVPSLKRNAC